MSQSLLADGRGDDNRAEPLLRVEHLSIGFAGRNGPSAVSDVSFTVGRGEVVGIVGESGSGKSVTARAVMGLISPPGIVLAGAIEFAGKDVISLSEARLRALRGGAISLVPQEPTSALNPVLRLGTQVAETLRLHGHVGRSDARRRSAEVLKVAEMPAAESRLRNYPHELSGGLNQRALIGMALANKPDLVIADEPTTALDVTIQSQIIDLIRRLNAELDMSVLFISHDLAVVSELCTRVIVMYAGRIVEEGPASEIFSRPRHPYTIGLLESIPQIDGPRLRRMSSIPGRPAEPGSALPGCAFAPRCQFAIDVCRRDRPELSTGETTGHPVACWVAQGRAGESVITVGVRSRGDQLVEMAATPGDVGGKASDPTTSEPVLRATDVVKTFTVGGKQLVAVRNVSLEIARGETVGLVGESGCGKSTLAKLLLRLEAPDAGSISWLGTETTKMSDRELRPLRKNVQMVFQNFGSSLNPRMTIGEILAEPIRLHEVASGREVERRVREVLERVGLPGTEGRYPHEFSGGQRQRINIARALAPAPSLIVCDEPTSALDVSIRGQIINLLQELQEQLGISYLMISHDLSVVRHIAHRVVVMYLGEVVEIGDAESVFARPSHPYTKALMAAVPRLGAGARLDRASLQGDVPNPLDPPTGCRFHPRCPIGPLADATRKVCIDLTPELLDATPTQRSACHFSADLTGSDYRPETTKEAHQ